LKTNGSYQPAHEHTQFNSAVIFAANNGHLEVLKELLNRGANMEDRSNNLKTPLLWASLWGHYGVVEYLVDRGANISAKDREGLTPLMSSVMNNHIKITRFLLDRGANALTKNYYNGTALSIAKGRGNEEMINLLLPFYAPEAETSPYKILFKIISDYTLMLTQIVVDVTCSVCGWKAIPLEEVPFALKEEALGGFPTIRQTTAAKLDNINSWMNVNFPKIQKRIMDFANNWKEETAAIIDSLQATIATNWPVFQNQIEQRFSEATTHVVEAIQAHYHTIFPVGSTGQSLGTSLNPDFKDASVGAEL
jgi:ankyrin repeat protein